MPAKKIRKGENKIKILIADREAIFRLGLKKVLSVEDDLRVVAQAENSAQVLNMAESFKPDLIIVQHEILLEDDPRNLISQIVRHTPRCKTMVTVSQAREAETRQLIEAGISMVISKSAQPEAFVKSAHATVLETSGSLVGRMPSGNGSMVVDKKGSRRPVDTLTRRELAIVSCLTQGWRNRDIAQHLAITEQTVKNHLRSVYDKVGVSDRLELVLYAIHQRLDLPPIDARG
jgi:DNA-binding NarL/FixJ family response regulator